MAVIGMMTSPFYSGAAENDIVFTYDYPGAIHSLFGVQRNVGIDVAMKIQDASLIGAKIKGISVNIPTKEGCSCDPTGSAWLSKKLQTSGEYNLPDLQEVNGLIRNYGTEEAPELRLDLTFPEAYTLTEEGVYVGYSVTVTSCNVPGSGWTALYPIETVTGIEKPETFWVHTTKGKSTLPQKYPEWKDLSTERREALAMRVILENETLPNSAILTPLQTLYAEPGTTGHVYTDLVNSGSNPISSFTYSYSVGSGEPVVKEWTLDKPLEGQLGAFVNLDLPFEVPSTEGEYSVKVKVEKVNGEPNGVSGTSTLNMTVVPFLPVNRPVLEEYTGFWCGDCPEAYVLIKQLRDKYGEDLLVMAYHSGDQVQGVESTDMPSSPEGIPSIYIGDREETVAINSIENTWLRKRRELAPAAIDVELYWNDTDHTGLRAVSTLKFINDDPQADYRLAYALLEDDMSSRSFNQRNFFSDKKIEGPYWDLFCGQPFVVSGLVFDDVVVSFPNTKGINNSVPKAITGVTEYKHDCTLYLKDAVCHSTGMEGKNIIMNPDKLRVMTLLVDGKTGNVCNAAITGYSKDARLFSIASGKEEKPTLTEPDVVETIYYTLEGVGSKNVPSAGTYLKVQRMSDGSSRTEKYIGR